ncbi:MAG: serine hydrolase domain-containing protein [Brevefilum sp.]
MSENHLIRNKNHTEELINLLEEHFENLIKNQAVKSAVLGVDSLDGDFTWAGAHGPVNLDGEPMQPDTPIWMASVTKLYIASTILKLFEDGQIDIDAKMSAYLPEDLIKGIHHMAEGEDHTDEITVRHLLSHSSGLPDCFEDSPKGEKSLLEQILEGNDREFSTEEVLDLVRNDLPAYFPPQPPELEKKKIRYSDTNYQLLMEIIKRVTGRSIHEAFTEFIYEPLGLRSTFQPGTRSGQITEEAAIVWSGDHPLDIPKAMHSFGDLGSTLGDMNKFMRGLIQGKFFSNSETWALMQRDFNSFDFSLNPMPTSPTWPIEYGLGLMRFEMPRLFTPFNPIPAVIGHTGVSGSWLFFCPELELILSGTVNQVAAAGLPFRFIPRLLGDRRWQSAGKR